MTKIILHGTSYSLDRPMSVTIKAAEEFLNTQITLANGSNPPSMLVSRETLLDFAYSIIEVFDEKPKSYVEVIA